MSQRDTTNMDGTEEPLDAYLEQKVCRLCTMTKDIPEFDTICKDCWELRMAAKAIALCPYYLYEAPGIFKDGWAPVELCYDCAFRSGWTEELGPICNHPIAVLIKETWGVETVLCPKASDEAGGACFVSMKSCKACEYHKGELHLAGRHVYCGVPHEKPVKDCGRKDENSPV